MKNYRNRKYMNWVAQQRCCVSGNPAQVAHHIRLGDNSSGVGIKPSDYRVIPLTNFYHTISDYAVHRMGERRFYDHFVLDYQRIQLELLERYCIEEYQQHFSFLPDISTHQKIEQIEEHIEGVRSDPLVEKKERQSKNRKLAKSQKEMREQSKSEHHEYHQLQLERARLYQKEMRQRSKEAESSDFKEQQKELARGIRRKRYQEAKERLASLS